MELKRISCKKPEYGVLVLGNVGVGKSYICNLIIGHQKFNTGFRRESVTTCVECHRIDAGPSDLLIYNIPGLIATDQDEIDRNKKEIIKAFEQCPISVVIFVWTLADGRPRPDDVIAFKILQEAYRFSSKSLIFVVNNMFCTRPSTYEGRFVVFLKKILGPMPISLEDIFFLDTLKSEDVDRFASTRDRLLFLIAQHQEIKLKMQADLIVGISELRMQRKLIKVQYVNIEESKETLERDIKHITLEYEAVKKDQETRYQDMMLKIEAEAEQSEEEDTDNEVDPPNSEIPHEEKKLGRKTQCQQYWKKIECEKGIVKKVEKSYEIARTQLLIINKSNKGDAANNCIVPSSVIEDDKQNCDKTGEGSFKKIQKRFNKMCHIKSNSDSLCPTVIGDGIGATFGGRMGAASVVVAGAGLGGVAGAALGGVAGIVFGPCAIATAAAGAVAGVAAGGIGGAILGLYRGRKRRCHRLVMEEKIHTRWYIVSP